MKNKIKLLLEISKAFLQSKECKNLRAYPKTSEFFSYFEKIIKINKTFEKVNIDQNCIVIGSCFSVRLAHFFYKSLDSILYEKNKYNLAANWGRVYSTANLSQIINYSIDNQREIFIAKKNKSFFDILREDSVSCINNKSLLSSNIIKHRQASYEAIKNASTIFIVLGINEVWFEKYKKIFWAVKPDNQFINNENYSFEVINLTYKQNLDFLRDVISKIKKINSNIDIVFALGPVPQDATYYSSNIVEDFFLAKSQIRLVINEIQSDFNDNKIHYFPLYEIVHFFNPLMLKSDSRHINDYYVDRILRLIKN